jgi:5-oxoprolinase (ATP-hydrolysing)
VTDCNVMVGKLQPDFFPQVFGPEGNLPLDLAGVQREFAALANRIQADTGDVRTPEQVADGFLAIAVEKMANAIKKISVQRGYDVSEYVLCCFGGAGGQHACLIAEALGMTEIFLHPYAGVLSAYGMGLADLRSLHEQSLELPLTPDTVPELHQHLADLAIQGKADMARQGISLPANTAPLTATEPLQVLPKVHLRYDGTDSTLAVPLDTLDTMRQTFETVHHQRYGFVLTHRPLIAADLSVEVIACHDQPPEPPRPLHRQAPLRPKTTTQIYTHNHWHPTPVYDRSDLTPGDCIPGPALIIEPTGTNVVEPQWHARLTAQGYLILTKQAEASSLRLQTPDTSACPPDPVLLEIFNNLFRAVAEEMGVTLQNTSYSVNIKERLDFSCALFDSQGQLVANAPHIPVHLGSMGESVQSLIRDQGHRFHPGDVYVMNNPYNGGTHLPDITVITPVFLTNLPTSPLPHLPIFYVASRGHHADIGGISPGSMPAHSHTIAEEGILIDHCLLVNQGQFEETKLLNLLTSGPYPARNPTQNLADLQAQVAANEKGVQELQKMVDHYGLNTVQTYMQHVQDNAEECMRQAIARLCQPGTCPQRSFTYPMDDGSQIQVTVTLQAETRSARIDFSGTSPQQPNNFNAPAAVCKAAVLYVFRTLIDDDIPLNAGGLKPLEILIPPGSMLNPEPPAAVVAGNVETSQAITDALYGALGIMAASQGTMNNFTFGNDQYQYYETICGGSGAGPDFPGTDAVQTHMTNSRLTDPEVLEWRFPVWLKRFEIRRGSGGEGTYPGGNGVIRCVQFRQPMTATILSNHRQIAPFGLAGGGDGLVGKQFVTRHQGLTEPLDSKATITLETNDILTIETPGGGGYGPPV